MNIKIVTVGIILVVISFILGGIQDLYIYNIYGAASNMGYFYTAITVILVVGIILVIWGLMRKGKAKQPKK